MATLKLCPACNAEKALSDFGKDSGAKDGLSSACKLCLAEKTRKYRSQVGYNRKVCIECHKTKYTKDFHCFENPQNGERRYASTCKACDMQQNRQYLPQIQECARCGKVKFLDQFYKNEHSGAHFTQCKECVNKKYPYIPETHRKHLLDVYGITEDHYMQILEEQGGVCAICHQPETRQSNGKNLPLIVDHCHTTNVVRGLLCFKCNTALGFLGEDLERAISLLTYVEDRCLW